MCYDKELPNFLSFLLNDLFSTKYSRHQINKIPYIFDIVTFNSEFSTSSPYIGLVFYLKIFVKKVKLSVLSKAITGNVNLLKPSFIQTPKQ